MKDQTITKVADVRGLQRFAAGAPEGVICELHRGDLVADRARCPEVDRLAKRVRQLVQRGLFRPYSVEIAPRCSAYRLIRTNVPNPAMHRRPADAA